MATKNLTVRIRCTEREKADWQSAAGGERAFSDWARRTLNGEAQKRALTKDEQVTSFPLLSTLSLAPATTAPSSPSGKKSYEPDFK